MRFAARFMQSLGLLRTYRGYDPDSDTLVGPIECVGDCVHPHSEVAAAVWIDTALPPRDGDLIAWHMPEQSSGERTATKWFLVIDGEQWIACKYFAVRRRPGWHIAAGRVVAELRAPLGVKTEANPE
jgi:hypothetical protein